MPRWSLVDRRINMALWQNCVCMLLPGPCEWELPLIIFLIGIEKMHLPGQYQWPHSTNLRLYKSALQTMPCQAWQVSVGDYLVEFVVTCCHPSQPLGFWRDQLGKLNREGEDHGACVPEILTCGANFCHSRGMLYCFLFTLLAGSGERE